MSITLTLSQPAAGGSARALRTGLTVLGTISFPITMLVAAIGGALTPGYNPISDTVSAIALGPLGWLQTANFYFFGLSVIAFGLALAMALPGTAARAAAALLGLSGLSLIAAGAFPAIVVDGEPTPSALLHGLAFFGTFLPLPGAYAFMALRVAGEPGWRGHALYSAALASSVFFLFAVVGVLADPGAPLAFIAGLLQRVLLIVAFSWLMLTGRRLLR